ncbi:MAG: tRNA 2-thiouridine(34) synthase MnmA [Clostridia bacterium]|nr:tRNA 2-thiouridine(34) synthase MnmA [Clostridia bacterium]
MKNRILVAMSGGVDSSACALLLQEAGYDPCGVTMKLFSDETLPLAKKSCGNPTEANDAARVAELLGIPFYVRDLSADFRTHVIDYFIRTYETGGTPNPCVECNKTMKFGKLLEVADELLCDGIATGHYARIRKNAAGRWELFRAKDASKDQTYVLWQLTQAQLSRTHFPLGDLTKTEVRELARAHGFCNAEKKESQDICFIPDGDYVGFIERTTKKQYPSGNFIDLDGNVLGVHNGCIRYTVGQRKGLGIAFGKPTYVCATNPADNTVTLGSNEDLFRTTLTARNVNLIAIESIDAPMRVQAKIRYQASPASAVVEQTAPDRFTVRFDEAQRAITPGQSVVLYDGDVVIGGGIIE